MDTWAFGIDIGGTAIKAGIFQNRILKEKLEIPTRREEGGEQIIPDVVRLIGAKMEAWERCGREALPDTTAPS